MFPLLMPSARIEFRPAALASDRKLRTDAAYTSSVEHYPTISYYLQLWDLLQLLTSWRISSMFKLLSLSTT